MLKTSYAKNVWLDAEELGKTNVVVNKILSSIANVENDPECASNSYNVGQLVFVDESLYKVIQPISEGDVFVVDQNIEVSNLGSEIARIIIESDNPNLLNQGQGISISDGVVSVKVDGETLSFDANGKMIVKESVIKKTGLENELVSNTDLGGIKSGDTFEVGTQFEDILRKMFNPTLYPNFTGPTCSISAETDQFFIEKGSTFTTTITCNFDPGQINPAYGTSGNRVGEIIGYKLNNYATQSGNTFNVTVTDEEKSFQVTVFYGQGDQPKDSEGNDYDSPYPAGSIKSNILTYELVYSFYANTNSIDLVDKLQNISYEAKEYIFNFPAQTASLPEIFDVPEGINITAVEVQNPFTGSWESCLEEFITSVVTHQDSYNNIANYTRYKNNTGYNIGARAIRIKWS